MPYLTVNDKKIDNNELKNLTDLVIFLQSKKLFVLS